MNFQAVVLNVSDLDKSIDFYHDVFGFTELSRGDQLAAIGIPGSERTQVLVLRTLGTTGYVGGAHHIGMRAFVLEMDSLDRLNQVSAALDRRKSSVTRRETKAWVAVVGHDPDRIAVVASCSVGESPITYDDWDLDELLYGLGE
ncbi:MAG TPA: VOC family protein [Acidimicrobiales bacterium]|nr:VOC family protein [Acidimicrobiales bacterium]